MQLTSRHFYQFSGFHSLIIGLLPFFLPVLLWDRGYSIAGIAAFISLTGVGFIGTLWGWDRLREHRQWKAIILLSFIAELCLVALLAIDTTSVVFVGLALINGAYNCFYWSTQRAMFNQITTAGNTGRTFGNIQILVVVLLKVGILIGGYLLENNGVTPILVLSLVIASIAAWQLLTRNNSPHEISQKSSSDIRPTNEPALSLSEIVGFKDNHRSKLVFLLDGPFLFLESYFWVLSLYFLTQQSFLTLGVVVVSLTLLLSIAFYFIKNKIDSINQQKVFTVAILLYALSWLLRGDLSAGNSTEFNHITLYSTILIIGFLTTFFRLVFNKRFFDLARDNTPYRYLLCKSYYSQFGIALAFGLIALLLFSTGDQTNIDMSVVYFIASPFALIYGAYSILYSSTTGDSDISGRHTQMLSSLTHPFLSIKLYVTTRHSRLVNKR